MRKNFLEDFSLSLSTMLWEDVFLRVALAIMFGLVIGLDRDIKDKPVDFRAYIIVAVTSCVVAITGLELFADYSSSIIAIDLGRIVAGVLTGIGFLGAGAIIRVDNNMVIGTATGASIWACGGFGLCLGFGFYGLAFIAFASVALTLILLGIVRRRFLHKYERKKELS